MPDTLLKVRDDLHKTFAQNTCAPLHQSQRILGNIRKASVCKIKTEEYQMQIYSSITEAILLE